MHVVSGYHPAIVAIHWVLALLIIADLTIGTTILAHSRQRAAQARGARSPHVGRNADPVPDDAAARVRERDCPAGRRADGLAVLDRVAWLSHRALYVAAIGLPLSGLALALQARLPQVVFLDQGACRRALGLSVPIRAPGLRPRADGADRPAHRRRRLSRLPAPRRPIRRMWFGRRETEPAAARTGGMAAPWFGRAVLLAATRCSPRSA